jgi:hypothetical protein
MSVNWPVDENFVTVPVEHADTSWPWFAQREGVTVGSEHVLATTRWVRLLPRIPGWHVDEASRRPCRSGSHP